MPFVNLFSTLSKIRLYSTVAVLCANALSMPAYAKNPVPVIGYQVDYEMKRKQVHAIGELKAVDSIVLAANVSRAVTKIHFKNGQQVEEGQLLVEFNNRQELAELKEKQIAAQEAQKQYKRLQGLKKRSTTVSQSQIDEQFRDWQILEAQINTLKAKLADLKISAPFSGQLGFKQFSEGSFIKQGEALVTLTDSRQMYLDLLVAEQYLVDLQIGQTIQFSSQAYENQQFNASIIAISPQLDIDSRMLKVRAMVDNQKGWLKSNMLVETNFALAPKKELLVPNKSILMLGDYNYVYKLQSYDPKANQAYLIQKVGVKVGEVGRSYTEILSGLQPGDVIVSQGVLRVREGKKVSLKQLENQAKQSELLKPKAAQSNQTASQVP